MNYIVYKTTNLVNGKYYVGVHRTNPDIFDGYIGCGVTNKNSKNPPKRRGFPAAVKKYGYTSFKRETLFVFPDTKDGMLQAYAKEAEIVTLDFVKSSQTYNLTVGGKWTVYNTIKKTIAQYTLQGKFIRTWDSVTEASNCLGLTSISQCLTGHSKYCGDFQWRYYTDESDIPSVIKSRTVYQFDLCGNLLKVWKSVNDASQLFENTVAAKTAIVNVCKNITRQAYGYYWSYKHIFEYREYLKTKAVAAYTDEGKFIKSYTSLQEAAKDLGLPNATNISAAIAGRQKHCSGYRWRYFYGNTSNIKPL